MSSSPAAGLFGSEGVGGIAGGGSGGLVGGGVHVSALGPFGRDGIQVRIGHGMKSVVSWPGPGSGGQPSGLRATQDR